MKLDRHLDYLLKSRHKDFLDKHKFKIIEDSYCESTFGDALCILQNAHLRLRIIRDRGEIFADIASLTQPEEWRQLSRVLVALNKLPFLHPDTGPLPLADLIALIERNYEALELAAKNLTSLSRY